ncbi:hypothetical protein K438DRAFT_1787454 [Mycena galopus ATCC 62051]|nr:hypothetical protein K438DRAFT_1787454 [Mycena galopus ATCC 62051]
MPAGDANAALPRPGEALCPRLHVVESACAIPTTLMGEKLEVNKDMDTETRKVLLGNSIQRHAASRRSTPSRKSSQGPLLIWITDRMSNGSMIRVWTILLALITGNALLINSSEAVCFGRASPGAPNVVHGTVPTVNAICTHPLSFVGGNNTGPHIYELTANTCSATSPRHRHAGREEGPGAECLAWAACGAACERCMSISVVAFRCLAGQWVPNECRLDTTSAAVFVGAAQTFIRELVARAGGGEAPLYEANKTTPPDCRREVSNLHTLHYFWGNVSQLPGHGLQWLSRFNDLQFNWMHGKFETRLGLVGADAQPCATTASEGSYSRCMAHEGLDPGVRVRENMDTIAAAIILVQGKTFAGTPPTNFNFETLYCCTLRGALSMVVRRIRIQGIQKMKTHNSEGSQN